MKMIASGNMRILKRLDGGEDVNGNPWAHFAAITCEEMVDDTKKNDFYILKTFGSMVEYVERNLTTPRRAFITGELRQEKSIKEAPIKKNVSIGGKQYGISFAPKFETQRACIFVNVCDFIDKKIQKNESKTNTIEDEAPITITEK